MPLNHKALISLVAAYQSRRKTVYQRGICHGFTSAYLNAYLLGKTDDFFKRLDVLAKYHDSSQKLKKAIRAARAKLAKKEEGERATEEVLTDIEKILIEIPAFFETMLLQQSPSTFLEVFPRESILSQNYHRHHGLSAPKEMVEPCFQHRAFHAGTVEETQAYFDKLADTLSVMSQRIGIQVSSDTHTFPLTFNKEKDAWEYFDINLLGKPYRENRPLLIPKAQIADFIHQGLSADGVLFMPYTKSTHSLFTIDFYTAKQHDVVQERLQELDIKSDDDEYYHRVNTNKMSLLSFYASGGDVEGVKTCLARSVNPNEDDTKGVSPLHYAVNRGDVDIAETLLEYGADINHQTNKGSTPLMRSISSRSAQKMLDLLLHKQADLSVKSNNGRTALMMAAEKGQHETLELLKPHLNPDDLNETDNRGYNALMFAIESNNLRCAKYLIDAGCEVNHINHQGMTALGYACMKGYGALVNYLLKKGAENQITLEGTPAALAREKGFNDLARKLEQYFSHYKQPAKPVPPGVIVHQEAFSRVLKALDDYIAKRERERLLEQGASILSLGLFNLFKPSEPSKQFSVKIETAKKLKKALLGKCVSFNMAEREGCLEGRLGQLFQNEVSKLITVPVLESALTSKSVAQRQASR